MAVVKLTENWAVTQLRNQVRDSLTYHGEQCILLSLYHAFSDPDAEKCPRCTNDVYLGGENFCPVCYGTGFNNGVKSAQRVWGLFTDKVVSEQYGQRGEYQPDSREGQFEPFPMLIEHDVVVRVRRWDTSFAPIDVEGFYIIQAVTRDSVRTGSKFGQQTFDVIGQKATLTRLADNVGVTDYPVLGVAFPEFTVTGTPDPQVVAQPDSKVIYVPVPENPGAPGTGSVLGATLEWTAVFTYTQTVPATVWTINHTLSHDPAVTVIVGEQDVIADVAYPTPSQVTITFALPQVGKAELI